MLHEVIFLSNLQRNAFARQVANEIARVTPPLRNPFRTENVSVLRGVRKVH